MTTVVFHTEGSRITGFTVSGHSGCGEEGEDIVCAAITSTVRLAECVINEVMGLSAAVKVNERTVAVSLRLPGSLGESAEDTCQNLLTGMMVYLSQLHTEYPEYVEVLEAEQAS